MSLNRHVILTLATLLVLLPSTAGAGEVEISEEAQRQFRTGVALLQDPAGARYEEAHAAFRAAYAASPSPKILGNLAFSAMNLERDGEAIEAYDRYLKEAEGIDTEERAQIEKDLEVLRAGVVTVKLTVSPPAATVIDTRTATSGARVVNRYGTDDGLLVIGIRAGHHRFRIEHPGYEAFEWELQAARGRPVAKTVELKETPTDVAEPAAPTTVDTPTTPPSSGQPDATERPVPVSVYIGLAATGAFGVAFGVLAGMSLGNKGDFDEAQDAGDAAAAQTLRDDGITLNIVADVMLGSAVVAAGVTTILFFTRPEVPAEGDQAALSVVPAVGPGVGGLMLQGSF